MLGVVSLIQLIAHAFAVVDLCPAELRRVGFRVLENRHHVVITADDPETDAVGGVLSRLVPPHRLAAAPPGEEVVRQPPRERTAICEIDEFHELSHPTAPLT